MWSNHSRYSSNVTLYIEVHRVCLLISEFCRRLQCLYPPPPPLHLLPSYNTLQQGITARWPVCLQYCQTREKAMTIIRPESVCSIARRHPSFLVHPQVTALLFTHSGTMPHLPPFLSYSPSFSFFSLTLPTPLLIFRFHLNPYWLLSIDVYIITTLLPSPNSR